MRPGFPLLAQLKRRPLFIIGIFLLAILISIALVGPYFYHADPWEVSDDLFLWPKIASDHPLGTDQMGRDVLGGLIHGARVSLTIGFVAALSTVIVGVALGAIAGYFGGRWDNILMRLTEVFQTIPNFLLLIIIVGIWTPKLVNIIVGIVIVSWPPMARLARAQVLSFRNRAFVDSNIILGMSHLRIIITQILPNCVGPLLVLTSVTMASSILLEAALAFLGLSDPNVRSWGGMIGDARSAIFSQWYLTALPGLAIQVTVSAISFIGDGLNDILVDRQK